MHRLGKAVVPAPTLGSFELGNEMRNMVDTGMTREKSTVVAQQLHHQWTPLRKRRGMVKHRRLVAVANITNLNMIKHEEGADAVSGTPLLGRPSNVINDVRDLNGSTKWGHLLMFTSVDDSRPS